MSRTRKDRTAKDQQAGERRQRGRVLREQMDARTYVGMAWAWNAELRRPNRRRAA